MRSLQGVERVDQGENGWEILLVEGTNPADAIRRIVQTIAPARIELSRPRLEDVFIKLVGGGLESDEDTQKLKAGLTNGARGAANA